MRGGTICQGYFNAVVVWASGLVGHMTIRCLWLLCLSFIILSDGGFASRILCCKQAFPSYFGLHVPGGSKGFGAHARRPQTFGAL